MRSVRIEPAEDGTVILVDIMCDCGNSVLTNLNTTETSFKQEVVLGSQKDIVLKCEACSEVYVLQPQNTHIHIKQLSNT